MAKATKRLVIQQNGRTIQHELDDAAIVIGRDPSCDLFFADRRLSRKHCRFEPTETGVRFVDLDSRNGSWVNRKKASEVDLTPGDVVRIGGLTIRYEQERPVPAEPLPPAPAPDAADTPGNDEDAATVMIARSALEPAGASAAPTPSAAPSDGEKTVLLPAAEKPKAAPGADDTGRLPPSSGETDSTVLLPRDAPRADAGGTTSKTAILRKDPPPPGSPAVPATRILTPADLREIAPPPSVPESGAPAETPGEAATEPAGRLAGLPWTSRFLLITTALVMIVYLFLAFPLVRTLGNTLRAESLRRGRALLELLAANSGTPVGEGRTRDLSVEDILREERVKDALLMDVDGKVLAPSSRSGETLTTLEGIDSPVPDIRTFYLGRVRGGDYVMVQPLLHRGRRVGLAVVVYEAASASGSWTAAILFLAFLVALLGVLVSLLLARRMTLAPVASLRDDVEAVVKGDAKTIPIEQGFSELADVAKSVNRLIDRQLRRTAASPSASPAADERAPREGAPRRAAPEPAPAPRAPESSPRPSAPTPGAVPASADGCRLWADENFIVVRAEPEAAELLGTSETAAVGKHLIEAVKDQKLLEAILDAVNGLSATDPSTARADVPNGGCEVTASREGTGVVVGLRSL